MKIILAFVVCAFTSTAVFAAGDAGCGLGSLIWRSNTKLTQLFAITTNSSFGTQTFGITTGTSNCTAHGLVMKDKEQIYYVEANFKPLSTEMAQGRGENLMAFSDVMGCSQSARSAFSAMTKARYESILPSATTTPSQMLDAVKKEIRNHPVLSKECKVIS